MLDLHEFLDSEDEEIIEADLKLFKAIKQYRLMDLGEFSVKMIRDRLDLQCFFSFFQSFNSSADAPYHNNYHSYCLVNNCYEGAFYEKLTNVETRALIAAALFHDFDHSAGKETDEVNIKVALVGLSTAQHYASSQGLGLTQFEMEAAISTIKVTSDLLSIEPVTSSEKIVRDANLMQYYESDAAVLYKQLLGMKEEITVNEKTSIARDNCVEASRAPFDKMAWHTIWAKEKAIVRDWEALKLRALQLFVKSHH